MNARGRPNGREAHDVLTRALEAWPRPNTNCHADALAGRSGLDRSVLTATLAAHGVPVTTVRMPRGGDPSKPGKGWRLTDIEAAAEGATSLPPEIAAMVDLTAILDSLDRDSRRRVLWWVADRYADRTEAPPQPARPRPKRTRPTRPAAPAAPAAILPADVLETGRQIAGAIHATHQPLTRRTLTAGFRDRGLTLSTDRAAALLHTLKGR